MKTDRHSRRAPVRQDRDALAARAAVVIGVATAVGLLLAGDGLGPVSAAEALGGLAAGCSLGPIFIGSAL